MKIIVAGTTDSLIRMNKVGVTIWGKNEAVLDIKNPDMEGEVNELLGLKLINIIQVDKPEVKILKPSISPNKNIIHKNNPVETDDVTISTGNGTIKAKMVNRVEGIVKEDNELTKESIETMNRLEAEEAEELKKTYEKTSKNEPIKAKGKRGRPKKIKPTEFIGSEEVIKQEAPLKEINHKAIICDEGIMKEVASVNNSVPGSEKAKEKDPFIDRDINEIIDKNSPLVDPYVEKEEKKQDNDDLFVEL